MGIRSERRVCKGHDTKRSDWCGVCLPEPLRLDGNNLNVWGINRMGNELPILRNSLVAANGRSTRPRWASF